MGQISYLEAYHMAIELVKKAGFTLHHVSTQTESCYYLHPARAPLLMRLSAHKSKHSPIGLNGVVARASFTKGEEKHGSHSPTNVRNRVTWAIGQYFLNEPAETRYRGKRGTWETKEPINVAQYAE